MSRSDGNGRSTALPLSRICRQAIPAAGLAPSNVNAFHGSLMYDTLMYHETVPHLWQGKTAAKADAASGPSVLLNLFMFCCNSFTITALPLRLRVMAYTLHDIFHEPRAHPLDTPSRQPNPRLSPGFDPRQVPQKQYPGSRPWRIIGPPSSRAAGGCLSTQPVCRGFVPARCFWLATCRKSKTCLSFRAFPRHHAWNTLPRPAADSRGPSSWTEVHCVR